MGPAPNPAVYHRVDFIAHGVGDFIELVECRARAIELSPAVLDKIMPVQPMSTTRFASATDIMPFRQN
jgi:hypothetical protein